MTDPPAERKDLELGFAVSRSWVTLRVWLNARGCGLEQAACVVALQGSCLCLMMHR